MKALLLVWTVAACTSSDSVLCSDGAHCPADTVCAQVTQTDNTMVDLCASNDEVSACVGKNEGDACATGTCHGGACVANACGNHLLDSGEQCDDGNQKSGDGCSADCLSNETCGNGVIDLANGEQCDDGALRLGHDGCSSTCTVERLRWRSDGSDRPINREHMALTYDEIRHRVVMFDGDVSGFIADSTIEWDGVTWRLRTPAATPTPRTGQAATYDVKRHDTVVFSGAGSPDTWTYDGTAWTQIPTAHAPSARNTSAMVYDAHAGHAVLFGGNVNATTVNDTWTFDGTDWTHVATPTSPPVRANHAMAYDPHRNVTVLFGGASTIGGTPLGDVWEFDGTTWAQKTFTGGPPGRIDTAMAFDPMTNKVMLTAGSTVGGTRQKDAWEWDGATWTQLANVPAAAGFTAHAMVTDAPHGRVVVYDTFGNLFYWNGGSWTVSGEGIYSNPVTTFQREFAMGFTDLVHRSIVVFGGSSTQETNGSGSALADTLILGDIIAVAAGTSPPARWAGAIAYDNKRDTAVLFGGCSSTAVGGSAPTCAALFADTWKWHGGWTPVTATTPPPGRSHAAMAYDTSNDRMVLFGGITGTTTPLDDTWLYDPATSSWTHATPTAVPPARLQAGMAYDPIHHQVIMFGGNDGTTVFADTWSWDGTNWTLLAPPIAPSPRFATVLVWDPSRRRLVLSGGRITLGTSIDESWEWDGASWTKPVVVQQPNLNAGRAGAVGVPSPDGAGIVMLGGLAILPGNLIVEPVNDRWRLRWESEDNYETCSDDDGDRDGLVGCADPDCWYACSSRCMPGDVTCVLPPTCGDGACDGTTESCDTCPADCGVCAPHCGDFTCNGTDSMTSCPGDCP